MKKYSKKVVIQIGDKIFSLKFLCYIKDTKDLIDLMEQYDIRILRDKEEGWTE